MSYIDKFDSVLGRVDIGQAKFAVDVRSNVIRIKDTGWTFNLDTEEGFYTELAQKSTIRTFNSIEKKFVIDKDKTLERADAYIINDVKKLFIKCSPAKEPRRTKVYKSFLSILNQNKGKIDFMSSLYDICEYAHKITQTESISHISNDVHRKNIFQLLSLMERSYGKTETNSN